MQSIHNEGGELLSECVTGSEARWLVRRLLLGVVFCSSSVGVVGEFPRVR